MRTRGILLAAAVVSGLLVTATPTPASAACDTNSPRQTYSFTGKRYTNMATNLKSDWLEGPGKIVYQKNTTATVSASVTASVSAEGGAIFAKASASLGVEVGVSWSRSDQWGYEKEVPNNREGRLRMYHGSIAFHVTKKVLQPNCKYKTVISANVTAPRKSGDNVWRLQTRAISKHVVGPDGEVRRPADDFFQEETTVGVLPAVEGELSDEVTGPVLPDAPITEPESDEPFVVEPEPLLP